VQLRKWYRSFTLADNDAARFFFFFPVIAPQGGEKRSLGKGKGKEQSKEK
jgi:hypothetical protein